MLAPVQAWLLSQGKCVGCGKPLTKKEGTGFQKITCVCGRVYMYDSGTHIYRRATFDEIK